MKFCPLQTWEAASDTDPKKGGERAQGPAGTSQGKGNRKKTRRGAPGTNARGPKGVRSHLLGDKRQANTRVQPTRGGPKASTKTRRGEGRGASQSQTPKPETQTQTCNGRNLPQKKTKQQSDRGVGSPPKKMLQSLSLLRATPFESFTFLVHRASKCCCLRTAAATAARAHNSLRTEVAPSEAKESDAHELRWCT